MNFGEILDGKSMKFTSSIVMFHQSFVCHMSYYLDFVSYLGRFLPLHYFRQVFSEGGGREITPGH